MKAEMCPPSLLFSETILFTSIQNMHQQTQLPMIRRFGADYPISALHSVNHGNGMKTQGHQNVVNNELVNQYQQKPCVTKSTSR